MLATKRATSLCGGEWGLGSPSVHDWGRPPYLTLSREYPSSLRRWMKEVLMCKKTEVVLFITGASGCGKGTFGVLLEVLLQGAFASASDPSSVLNQTTDGKPHRPLLSSPPLLLCWPFLSRCVPPLLFRQDHPYPAAAI